MWCRTSGNGCSSSAPCRPRRYGGLLHVLGLKATAAKVTDRKRCFVRSVVVQRGEMPMSAHLRLVVPRHDNRTVPVRPSNALLRQREYLTPAEVDTLMAEARQGGRYGKRDA